MLLQDALARDVLKFIGFGKKHCTIREIVSGVAPGREREVRAKVKRLMCNGHLKRNHGGRNFVSRYGRMPITRRY